MPGRSPPRLPSGAPTSRANGAAHAAPTKNPAPAHPAGLFPSILGPGQWCWPPRLLSCLLTCAHPTAPAPRRKEEHIVFLVLGGWGVGIWGASKVGAQGAGAGRGVAGRGRTGAPAESHLEAGSLPPSPPLLRLFTLHCGVVWNGTVLLAGSCLSLADAEGRKQSRDRQARLLVHTCLYQCASFTAPVPCGRLPLQAFGGGKKEEAPAAK